MRYAAHAADPLDNVRVHVGPVLSNGLGPYNVPQYGDYRSRAGYHVVDKSNVGPSRNSTPTVPDAATFQSWGLHAFHSRRYHDAMRFVKHAIVEDERNGRLHLLLSQTQLAVGQHEAAADSLNRGLALLDRPDWGHVVQNRRRLYASNDYDRHLGTLSRFINQNPNAAYARFLRGYHSVYLGETKAAREHLQMAAESSQYQDLALGLLDSLNVGGTEELPPPMD